MPAARLIAFACYLVAATITALALVVAAAAGNPFWFAWNAVFLALDLWLLRGAARRLAWRR